MGRIFFFIALAALIYLGIVLARRRRIRDVARRTRREQAAADQALPMIRCPVCGTHFPADEAVMGRGVRYCSEKCRDKVRASMDG